MLVKTMVGIVALVGLTLTLIVRRLNESTQHACAEHMRQIVQGYGLYMTDNNDQVPDLGWTSPEVKPYFGKKSKRDLLCPKARLTKSGGSSTYIDFPAYYRSNFQGKKLDAKLPGGWSALPFDVRQDAILKCDRHGDHPTTLSSQGAFPRPSVTVFTYYQTAYLDGHVRFAPRQTCWHLAWKSRKLYERYPYLIPQCDGRLERTSNHSIVELPQ